MATVKDRQGHGTTFVDRELELLVLDWWRDEVLAGSPLLVLLRGQRGVGMSRLVHEWAQGLRRREFRLLQGTCYPDGAPPFIALATAVDRIAGMSDLFLTADPRYDPAGRELQLYLRITNGLLSAATHQPTALILQDLHWADLATCQIVRHIAARAADRGDGRPPRLLLVATYCPDEVPARTQPIIDGLLSETIARPLRLEGLDEPAMTALLTELGGGAPGPAFVQWVLGLTGGRPLSAINLFSLLESRDLVDIRQKRLVTRVPTEHLPVAFNPGEAWRARIAALSSDARELLQWVAILGDEVSVEELGAVLGPDGKLRPFLNEAERAGVLLQEAGRIRFTQTQLRQAAQSALSEKDIRAREGDIARRLLAYYGEDAASHASDIVHHLRRGPSGPPFEGWLRDLAVRAAEQASAVAAWGNAATYYEDSLRVSGPQDPVRRRVSLHMQAAQAHIRNQDFQAAKPHLLTAIDLARESRDNEAWGEALFWLTNVDVVSRNQSFFDERLVDEFLESGISDAADEQALVLANVASHRFGEFDLNAGALAIRRARQLITLASRPWVRHFVAEVDGVIRLGRLELDAARTCFAEAVAISPEHEDPWQAAWAEVGLPLVQLLSGEHDSAESSAARAEAASYRTNQWNLHGLALACQGSLALARGRAHDAARWARAAIQSYRRSDYFYAAFVAYPTLAGALAYLGDREHGLKVLEEWRTIAGSLAAPHEILLEALCGDRQRARQLIQDYSLSPLPTAATVFTLNQAVTAVEVGDRVDALNLLEEGYAHLVDAYASGIQFSLEWSVCIPRVLAQAAMRLQDVRACERWLEAGFDVAHRAASPLEMARLRVVNGRMLLAKGNADEGLRQLDRALRFFEASDLMALGVETRRMAPAGGLSRRQDIVVVLVDLRESGTASEEIPEVLFHHLRREFRLIAHQVFDSGGGTLFRDAANGIGARFNSVSAALSSAFMLRTEADRSTLGYSQLAMAPRVAIAAGDAYDEDGVLSGRLVVRAARMLEGCEDGQVVVDEEVKSAADPAVGQFIELTPKQAASFSRREVVYGVEPTEAEFA